MLHNVCLLDSRALRRNGKPINKFVETKKVTYEKLVNILRYNHSFFIRYDN